jgi:hypothetical protein
VCLCSYQGVDWSRPSSWECNLLHCDMLLDLLLLLLLQCLSVQLPGR